MLTKCPKVSPLSLISIALDSFKLGIMSYLYIQSSTPYNLVNSRNSLVVKAA